MKLIYMEQTLTHIVNSNKTKETIDFATRIVNSGEHKQTASGIRYVVLTAKETK
jgi:hypothetical protein